MVLGLNYRTGGRADESAGLDTPAYGVPAGLLAEYMAEKREMIGV